MLISHLGTVDCATTIERMRAFTETRRPDTLDTLWLCEHPAVFTQGLAGKSEHLLSASAIPILPTNRGGQITYHGPGQVVAYPLIDLKRLGIYVKEYVYRLECAIISTLQHWDITGYRVHGAPGIYVHLDNPGTHHILKTHPQDPFAGLGKIAALGIKVSRHCTYHGLALNVDMDLAPFSHINPCGYAGLRTVDLAKIGIAADCATVGQLLGEKLQIYLC
jgi:lipoyl(octanoyl) transferase